MDEDPNEYQVQRKSKPDIYRQTKNFNNLVGEADESSEEESSNARRQKKPVDLYGVMNNIQNIYGQLQNTNSMGELPHL